MKQRDLSAPFVAIQGRADGAGAALDPSDSTFPVPSSRADVEATPSGPRLVVTSPAAALSARVGDAIRRAQQQMLSQQFADGSFRGVNDGGPNGTAWALVFERYLLALAPHDASEGVRYLRAQQLADGSVPSVPGSDHGSVDGTGQWYAGMWAGGVSTTDPAMVHAFRWFSGHGGLSDSLITTKVLLAVAGVIKPEELPDIPLFFKLIPGNVRIAAAFLGLDWSFSLQLLAGLIHGLRKGGGRPSLWLNPIEAFECKALVDYMFERQDPGGGWIGVAFETLITSAMLVSLGVERTDPRILRALEYARTAKVYREDGLFFQPFRCDLWDTAQYVRALVLTGVAAGDAPIQRAVQYLLDRQTTRCPPWDWQTPPKGAPTTGGWPFEPGNELNPDLDSSQEVLSALVVAARGGLDLPGLDIGIRAGEAYVTGMQNRDGGWSAFMYGKPSQRPGPMFLPDRSVPPGRGWVRTVADAVDSVANVLVAYGDPSTADVTARMLWTLGELGHSRSEPNIARAIELIKYQRYEGNGAWWGMWTVCFLPATSYVITGLAKVGVSPAEPWIQTALAWMLSRQNPDGGWGESVDAFENPALAGCGPSMRGVTAYVVWALCVAGESQSEACRRGVTYLLDHQLTDGLWADSHPIGVMLPRAAYYSNTTFATYVSLEALGAFQRNVDSGQGD